MRTRWIRATIALVAVAMLSGCSGDETTPAGTKDTGDTGGPASGVVTVTIAGFAFEPANVVLTQGDSLTIRNEDTTAHTFTMDDGSIDVALEPGQQVEVTPDTGGPFHCEIHASMTGTLELG